MAESLKMSSDFDSSNKNLEYEDYLLDTNDLENNLDEIEKHIDDANKDLAKLDIEDIYIESEDEQTIINTINNNSIIKKINNILSQQTNISDDNNEPKTPNNINIYNSL